MIFQGRDEWILSWKFLHDGKQYGGVIPKLHSYDLAVMELPQAWINATATKKHLISEAA
jgi:hypothetical protein